MFILYYIKTFNRSFLIENQELNELKLKIFLR